MKLGCVGVAYWEPRFITPYIESMQNRVDEVLILNSIKPWQGDFDPGDKTAEIAEDLGATVIRYDWKTEQDQRNAGQEYFSDKDWVIVLDPDEFLTTGEWNKLIAFLETTDEDAYVCKAQNTYWKKGFVIEPREDYKQIIAVRPNVRFVDKRVVNGVWGYAPVTLDHFSWARTDDECWKKITHYSHAHEFDPAEWFGNVWQSDRLTNLHPLTPKALKEAIPVILPKELEDLRLWP